MQNNDRKAMIQNGFDTVAEGCDHPSLFFFPQTAKRLIEHLAFEDATFDIFIKRFETTGREVPPSSWRRLATEAFIKEHFDSPIFTKHSPNNCIPVKYPC